MQLIAKMEEVFDAKRFPEVFLRSRTFNETERASKERDKERYGIMKETINEALKEDQGSAKCTFEILVRYRQNATWQGHILWAEKNKKQNFRSVLEMLKLMDEALMDSEESIKPIEWEG
jgi:hypothetical protein